MAMGVGAPALGDGDDVALVNAHIQDGGASAASMFEPVLGKLGLAKDDYEAALQTMSMMFGEEHAWAREARHICCPPPLILQVKKNVVAQRSSCVKFGSNTLLLSVRAKCDPHHELGPPIKAVYVTCGTLHSSCGRRSLDVGSA
eukprot:CAMPEP_0177348826 /NCGR_PEP_ID=MMETSP0368-20130122/30471_1 /TAXON_ID=447022 ORGANISM="Scrippsiella hangoei-like, Strain SHHI-4" /NCGR_SAMPLE_ID=MMETSP0368 /ASSEMBLY_ACC=CAM_ASM_000363 /LENGTH=143 /DNA_ID=CAMNT_0018810661 /DNA_START=44 /DNA_END=473 /DNA_ORIENTATION=-